MTAPLPADALPADLRRICVASAATCALPMLLQLPGLLAGLLAAGYLIGLFSHRRWPGWLRALLTVSLVGAVMTGFGFKIGRDTASALLVAMLALKTLELDGSRDGRSLIGFSLFAPFAGFLQDQGPLTLALTLPAIVAVVVCLQRLSEADRVAAATVATTALKTRIASAVGALALALPLALAAFWLFPRLAGPLWGMPDNASSRTGMNDKMSPGDWLDVMNDDTPAFRVRFFGDAPSVQAMYWRGPVLSQFDGRTWTRAARSRSSSSPAATHAPDSGTLDYEITLDPTDRTWLFALDLPEQISVPASIDPDFSVVVSEPINTPLRYRARSNPSARAEVELPAEHRRAMLALPAGFNPRSVALARQWRADSGSDREIIGRALDWIHREFSYSLETPLLGRNSVDEFLFGTRLGFCEHFSSSFVVLMRAAGIPARVVTGYAGGYRNKLGNFWLIRQSDAHAWAEVWLPGQGWQRVDPTAAVAPERVFETINQSPVAGALGMIRGASDLGDWARNRWTDFLLQFNAARQRTLLKPFGIDEATTLQLGLAFSTGAGLALALTLWMLLRGHRQPIDPVLAAWRRLERRLTRAGWPKAANEPVLSYGERVAREQPALAEPLRTLSRRFADWRYADHAADAQQQRQLIQDLSRVDLSRMRLP